MKVNKFLPGMVFMCNDQIKSDEEGSRHNYIVIGQSNQGMKHMTSLLQCMTITSMRNHDVTYEVPIVMSNNQISYIVPYSIFTINPANVNLSDYRGMVDDSDYTRDDFLLFLKNLYVALISNDNMETCEVGKSYRTYYEWFFETNKDKKEYRDVKEEKERSVNNFLNNSKANNKNGYQYSASSGTPSVTKRPNAIVSGRPLIKPLTPPSPIERSSGKKIQKDLRKPIADYDVKEESAIQEDVKPMEPVYSDGNISVGIKIPENIKIAEEKKTKERHVPTELIPEIKDINNYPRNLSSWTSKEMLTFVVSYEEYGFLSLSKYIKRWATPQAMSVAYRKCKVHLTEKNIAIPKKRGGGLHVPCRHARKANEVAIVI